jgi:gliding motility-associated protein GldE
MELILIFIFLILLSAFFSGTETAYFNVKTHRENVPKKVVSLLNNPRRLLISLLTGNTFVNIVIASLAAISTQQYAQENQWSETVLILVEVFVVSGVVLIFGEIFPKLLAIRNSEKFAEKVYLPLKFIMLILSPITLVFHTISNLITELIPMQKEKIFDSEEELKILTELGEETGTLQEEESDMIQSIFEFNEKNVREIMTPRVDMVALDSAKSIDEVMDMVSDKQFSKIPIYKKNIDNIKGILYAKDLLPYLMGSRPNIPLTSIAREPFFVPETKLIDDLMKDFRYRKTNVAIVVDEWGGTSGLITLEDIVEEVLGEIRDPYDKEESPIVSQKDNTFIVDAKISIYDYEEEFELEFPEDREYDTLGGYILDTIGDIPKVEQQTQYLNHRFMVKQLDGNRIGKVSVQIEQIIEENNGLEES